MSQKSEPRPSWSGWSGTSVGVSRSLHRRRPSPFEWRVASHIDDFEACSMFTHVAALRGLFSKCFRPFVGS
jgi:hypothetical protein